MIVATGQGWSADLADTVVFCIEGALVAVVDIASLIGGEGTCVSVIIIFGEG